MLLKQPFNKLYPHLRSSLQTSGNLSKENCETRLPLLKNIVETETVSSYNNFLQVKSRRNSPLFEILGQDKLMLKQTPHTIQAKSPETYS